MRVSNPGVIITDAAEADEVVPPIAACVAVRFSERSRLTLAPR